MPNFISAISSLAVAATLISCNVIDSNSVVTTNFMMQVESPEAITDAEGRSISLSNAFIAVKKIQFRSFEEGSDSFKTIHYNGPFYIDLLTENPKPFGEIELPPQGIRRVKMLLHKSHDLPRDPLFSVMDNKSIFISGTIGGTAEGTGGIMFTFSDDETSDFILKDPIGVVPEEGKSLIAVMKLPDLFKKINFSALEGSTDISAENRIMSSDPCPQINPSAKDLYSCFVTGMAQESKLAKHSGNFETY